MGAQFCVALLRLKRLTGLRNHQHLLDLESDIIGTQSKVVRLVLWKKAMTLCSHLNKPHTAVEFGLIETIQQTKTTLLINLFLLFVLSFSAFCFLAVEFLSSCNLLKVSEILIMFSVTINLPGNDYRLPSFLSAQISSLLLDTFPLGADSQRCDCHSGSEALLKKQMKA